MMVVLTVFLCVIWRQVEGTLLEYRELGSMLTQQLDLGLPAALRPGSGHVYALREARDGSQRGCRGTGPPARESFQEGRVFEGLRASMPSRLLQAGQTGCRGSKGCLCDGFGSKIKR